jgi:class 3 adenylate cyclase/pimeloyl-ACP methyl ester carboxylesterase
MTFSRYVNSFDGVSLAVTVHGDEHAAPAITVSPWTVAAGGRLKLSDTLAAHRQVAGYNRRGTGASSRDAADLGLDAQVGDVIAVADALGFATADVLAFFDGTAIAIACAARFPARVRKLVLWHPIVDGADWIRPERVRGLIDLARTDWTLALHTLATILAPRGPIDYQRELAKGFLESLTPDVFIRSLQATQATNVIDEARAVQAETLILSPSGAGVPIRHSQQVASLIPGATLMPVEQLTTTPGTETAAAIILRFLDGATGPSLSPQQKASVTAIILFADIVDSTALTERLGDAVFRAKASALDLELRRAISGAGGTTIDAKTLGDGVLATFPAASQGIAAALACGSAGSHAGLPLHLGLHAGDVIREEGNVFGGAVNIAARISAMSAAGEVLVSATVRDLARTSAGVEFEDRGEQALKGVGDAVRVYVVLGDGVRKDGG